MNEPSDVDIKEFVSQCQTRLEKLFERLDWTEEATLKHFNKNSVAYFPKEVLRKSSPPNRVTYPETCFTENSLVLETPKLQEILQNKDVEAPSNFTELQTNFSREEKLKIYEHVIENTKKLENIIIEQKVEGELSLADILAQKKREEKRKKRRFRKSKPTHIEEVRCLVDLQMQALQQFMGNKVNDEQNSWQSQTSKTYSIKNEDIYMDNRRHGDYYRSERNDDYKRRYRSRSKDYESHKHKRHKRSSSMEVSSYSRTRRSRSRSQQRNSNKEIRYERIRYRNRSNSKEKRSRSRHKKDSKKWKRSRSRSYERNSKNFRKEMTMGRKKGKSPSYDKYKRKQDADNDVKYSKRRESEVYNENHFRKGSKSPESSSYRPRSGCYDEYKSSHKSKSKKSGKSLEKVKYKEKYEIPSLSNEKLSNHRRSHKHKKRKYEKDQK